MLLKWLKTQVDRYYRTVDCVGLVPDNFVSHHDLITALTDTESLSARTVGWLSSLTRLHGLGVGFSRPAAVAVARRFIENEEKSIPAAAFKAAVSSSVDTEMEELAKAASGGEIRPAAWIASELRNLGVVWSQIGQEELCEPGISSLMNYVAESADDYESELMRVRESQPLGSASG